MGRREIAWAVALGVVVVFGIIQSVRISHLSDQVAELESGAERSIGKANEEIKNGNFDEAVDILGRAASLHPELKLQTQYRELLQSALAGQAHARREKQQTIEEEKRRLENKGLVVWQPRYKSALPPNFSSTDIRSLYSMLADKLPRAKDQFETEAEAATRLRAAFKNVHLGAYSVETEFLFSTDIHTFLTYDAAKKGYRINLSESATITSESENHGTFEGQNAFGAKKEITRTTLITHELQLPNYKKFQKCLEKAYGYCFREDVGFIPFSGASARSQADDLRVVYVVKLCPPYAEHSTSTSEATITAPEEMTFDTYKVHGELVRFLIVSHSSGEIIYTSPEI